MLLGVLVRVFFSLKGIESNICQFRCLIQQVLIVKTSFKSHFKIKGNFSKNRGKRIFVKNMFIFLLFTKIFVKNCLVSFFFKKFIKNKTNILKAPSRHKKFFHQVFYEFFQIKFFFKFKVVFSGLKVTLKLFKKFNKVFLKIGSNTLNRVKISISFSFQKLYLL